MNCNLKRIAICAVIALCGLSGMAQRNFASWPKINGEYPDNMPEIGSVTHVNKYMRVDKLGNSKWDNADGHDLREVITEGEMRVLVVLVNFADYKFSVSEDPRQTFDDMLNLPGFDMHDATGSVYDYFNDISFGKFKTRFDVYGPVDLDNPEIYYVKNDGSDTYIDPDSGKEVAVYRAGYMVEEVCSKLDGEIDFSQYDSNNDGAVDFIYFFHAGRGATDSGGIPISNLIWPHAFTLKAALGRTLEFDGVEVNRYATSCELNAKNRLMGIGMFAHEFSHVLGLPDLYDTANNNGQAGEVFSPGSFDCMDAGNYNNNIHTPPVYSAYERYGMEWMKPVEITGSASVTLLPLTAAEQAYKVSSPSNPQEYYLFEARAPYSWDKYLEAHGLAVWHIDFNLDAWMNNRPNNQATHQRVDLIEADNTQNRSNRDGDLFPGTAGVCDFVPETLPAFVTWNGKSTGYGVERIRRYPEGSVSMDFVAESGHEMEGVKIDPVDVVSVESVSADCVVVKWEPSAGATDYRVVVYPLDAFDGCDITDFVSGCYFASTGGETRFEIKDVDAAHQYGVIVYACNELNAVRGVRTLVVQPHADGELTASPSSDGVMLTWTPIEGAESYSVQVCEMQLSNDAESKESVCTFDDNRLPEGWTGKGKYDDRSKYSGESAPSYKIENGGWIETGDLPDGYEIENIDFWCRQSFDEAVGVIDVYGKDSAGVYHLIEQLTGFEPNQAGSHFSLKIPAGYTSLRLVYTATSTGLTFSIDDIVLSAISASEYVSTPVFDEVMAESQKYVSGLKANTLYMAQVAGLDASGSETGALHSRVFKVSEEFSGVDAVIAEDSCSDAAFSVENGVVTCADRAVRYDVYGIDGRSVAYGVRGAFRLPGRGVYIIRSGEKSLKVLN